MRQTWEYKNIVITMTGGKVSWVEDAQDVPASSPSMVSKAQALGDQGWELVSVTSWAGAIPFTVQ